MKYYQQSDEEWVQPKMAGYLMACCDCGLVHVVDFRVVNGVVQMRATRDIKRTKNRRKSIKPTKQ